MSLLKKLEKKIIYDESGKLLPYEEALKELSSARDELKKHLDEQGVETMISWGSPMYNEAVFVDPKYTQEYGGKPRLVSLNGDSPDLSETERICREVISLPMYPELTNEDVGYVCSTIKTFYQ